MQERDQKRAPQRRGSSPEQGEQGAHGRQRLAGIAGCQRLRELTELGTGTGTVTAHLLDQGGHGGRALYRQAVVSHEPPQHRDQPRRARVGRDAGEIRQHGSVIVPVERIQGANQEFPGGERRAPRNGIQACQCPCWQGASGHGREGIRHGACQALQGMLGGQHRRLGQHCGVRHPAGEDGFEFALTCGIRGHQLREQRVNMPGSHGALTH